MTADLEPLDAFRRGVAPLVSVAALEDLAFALLFEDPRIAQRISFKPVCLSSTRDWPVEACCPVCFLGWMEGHKTVGQLDDWFVRLCKDCDAVLGQVGGIRVFLNWFDDGEACQVREQLRVEVEAILTQRRTASQHLASDEKGALP